MINDGAAWSELGLHDLLCAFSDSRFAPLVGHWLALRQDDGIPHRGAVDPSHFGCCLDIVWLLERHADGRYRYRLAGQTIAELHGGIRRGTEVSGLFSRKSLEMFQPRWEAVLDRGQLVRAQGIVSLADGAKTSHVERLMLPLRSDDGTVSVVLGATHYEKARKNEGRATAFPPTNIQCCSSASIPLGACPCT